MKEAISNIYNIHITGNGTQPIVFVHGLACDQTVWRFVARDFENEFRVIRFDFIGSGKSDLSAYDKTRHSTIKGYAEDVIRICKELQLENVIFVGHSVAGMIGMHAAIEAPSIFSKLIMLAPSPSYLNDGAYHGGFEPADLQQLLDLMDLNYYKWAAHFAPIVVGNPASPQVTKGLTELFCTADPEITKKFARISFLSDHRRYLSQLSVPTLIMQCREDVLAPIEVGYYLKDEIRDSELVLMNAKGHSPHLTEPLETVEIMIRYIRQDA